MSRTCAAVLFVLALAPVTAGAADGAPEPGDRLRGVWLFDDAQLKQRCELGRVRESVVTVAGDSFTLTKLMGAKTDLKGTLAFDPSDPTAVDLKIAELDLSELLPDYKLPAGTLAGRYKLAGDRLTICFPRAFSGKRPTEFVATADQYLIALVRAPKDFKALPKEFTVAVIGADGKPVPGATVCQHMSWREREDRKEPAGWECYQQVKCGADGTVTLQVENVRAGVLIARGPSADTMGLIRLSPAELARGTFRVELRPQVRVAGTLVCDELTKAGESIGWAGGYLLRDGAPVAFYSSQNGKFEFLAPAGKYALNLYGAQIDGRYVEVTVPDRAEYAVGPVAVKALAFALLKGKPAPELEGVVGWKGTPVKFADLKGKYVVVDFWGYWCGPCVHAMPVLIELHEKYAEKGVAVVGVHVDIDGEIDTAAKLNAKLVTTKKDLWKGKDTPFPSALIPGTRVGDEKRPGGAVAQYGVRGFPTTLLIDRDGRVVGEFDAHDIKKASAEIDKLLAGKK
jgi:uncharacterized protein (TIGR03067 family)